MVNAEKLQKYLDNWIADNSLTVTNGPFQSTDLEGTSYTTFCNGYAKPEGECSLLYWSSFSEETLEHFFSGLLKWLDGRSKIVWRMKPCVWEGVLQDPISKVEVRTYSLACRLTAYANPNR